MSVCIFNNEENNYEKMIESYFLSFFKNSFDKIYNQNVIYNANARFFDIKHKVCVESNKTITYLKASFDMMLDYLLKNKIEDTTFANDVINTIITHFYFTNIKISADLMSYVLEKTKEVSLRSNRDLSIIGPDTFFNLFIDSLYKQHSTKKEREHIYSYIFNERKDLLDIENYEHLNGYCLNKERNISEYFGVGLYILTHYPEYKEQALKFLKLLVYKKEDMPSSYSFKQINFKSVKVEDIPEDFFSIMNMKVLLVIRNYQGVNSKIGKRIDQYITENLNNEKDKIIFSIYTAITLNKGYIYKVNKSNPDIFSIYLKKAFDIMDRSSHILYQCEDFIKVENLNLDIRAKDFWNTHFYPLIIEYTKGGK